MNSYLNKLCVTLTLVGLWSTAGLALADSASDYSDFLKTLSALDHDKFTDILIHESNEYLRQFPNAPDADNIHFKMAAIFSEKKWHARAFMTHLEIAHLYPQSEFVVPSQDQVRNILMQEKKFQPLKDRIEEIINGTVADSSKEAAHYALIRKLYYLNFDEILRPLVSSCELFLRHFPHSTNRAEVNFWKAELLARNEEHVQALTEYLKVTSLHKQSVFVSASQIKIADLQTDEFKLHQNAIITLNEFVKAFPEDPQAAQAQFRKAQIIEKKIKKPIEAIDAYTEVSQKYPNSLEAVPALFEAAHIYESKFKEYNKAVQVYATVVRDFKEDLKAPYALTESARIYEDKLKDYSNAASIYHRVYELFPDSNIAAESLFAAGEISEKKLKDSEAALTHYRTLVDKYPSTEVAEKATKRIQKLSQDDGK
ncbi:tetratricopeptide repeat protein [bacterium]|nr:tetratricopeptide repeat protein [bacterium]